MDTESLTTQPPVSPETYPPNLQPKSTRYADLVQKFATELSIKREVQEIFQDEVAPQYACNPHDLLDDAYSSHADIPIHPVFREDNYSEESRP